MTGACPFCGAETVERLCSACGRDTKGPRKACSKCGKFMPSDDRSCCHCGASQVSELAWKVPVIIGLFVVATIVSVVLAMVE